MRYKSIKTLANGQFIGALSTMLMAVLVLPSLLYQADTPEAASALSAISVLVSAVGLIICLVVMLVGSIMALAGLVSLRNDSPHFMIALIMVAVSAVLGLVEGFAGDNRYVDIFFPAISLVLEIAMAWGIFSGLADLGRDNQLPLLQDRMLHGFKAYRNSVFVLIVLDLLSVAAGVFFSDGNALTGGIIASMLVAVLGFLFGYLFFIKEVKLAGRCLNAVPLMDLQDRPPFQNSNTRGTTPHVT